MNIEEISNTIEELENGDTTFVNCQKLASLYIVRENFKIDYQRMVTPVEEELNDILPQYQTYCEVKRRYQLNEVTEPAVIDSLNRVCKEIREFLHTLYSGTDMEQERYIIVETLQQIVEEIH